MTSEPSHGEAGEHGGYGLPDVPRFQPELAARGVALAAAGLAMLVIAIRAFRAHALLLAPVSLAGVTASVLFGWAAAIHLTGGERFDDHPFL